MERRVKALGRPSVEDPYENEPPSPWSNIKRAPTVDPLDIEISNYINLKPVEINEFSDVLSFWRSKEHEFPTISKLAKKILGIPASSAPSERLFSLLKRESDPMRSSMDHETLSSLVLCVTLEKFIKDIQ